jgi:hypothetical protein
MKKLAFVTILIALSAAQNTQCKIEIQELMKAAALGLGTYYFAAASDGFYLIKKNWDNPFQGLGVTPYGIRHYWAFCLNSIVIDAPNPKAAATIGLYASLAIAIAMGYKTVQSIYKAYKSYSAQPQ